MTSSFLARELFFRSATAAIAQLGERQTEDLKVPGSIPGLGIAHVNGHVHACTNSQVYDR